MRAYCRTTKFNTEETNLPKRQYGCTRVLILVSGYSCTVQIPVYV
eukprot:SAG11_NODE_7583_length_1125_cov_1.891813_1_plen_44_part_10